MRLLFRIFEVHFEHKNVAHPTSFLPKRSNRSDIRYELAVNMSHVFRICNDGIAFTRSMPTDLFSNDLFPQALSLREHSFHFLSTAVPWVLLWRDIICYETHNYYALVYCMPHIERFVSITPCDIILFSHVISHFPIFAWCTGRRSCLRWQHQLRRCSPPFRSSTRTSVCRGTSVVCGTTCASPGMWSTVWKRVCVCFVYFLPPAVWYLLIEIINCYRKPYIDRVQIVIVETDDQLPAIYW